MKTSRRGFFATLAALPVIAKYLPQALKPKPQLADNLTVSRRFMDAFHQYPRIGDTIRIRRPHRFIAREGLEWAPQQFEDFERFVIQNEEDLAKAKQFIS